jgi:hypothetical protein
VGHGLEAGRGDAQGEGDGGRGVEDGRLGGALGDVDEDAGAEPVFREGRGVAVEGFHILRAGVVEF